MTLEEALAAAEVDTQEDNVIVIDNDLRTISIPAGIKNLGVESDDDVHRLYFRMPGTYGEFDLSAFDIRVNYKNGNQGDVYAVEDKAVDGDVITFSWLVGRNAVKTKGTTQFIVCLKKSDANGIVQQEFNTTLASLPVLEGLETTEQVVQENPDIIEQILKKLDGATTISPEQIAAAVETYMAAHPVDVPTELSELNDDADHRTVTDAEKKAWNDKSDFSGDYSDLNGKPEIPGIDTNLSTSGMAADAKVTGDAIRADRKKVSDKAVLNGTILEFYKTGEDNKLFAIDLAGLAGGKVPRIEKLATDTTVELQPNTLYIFPEMASITYTLAAPTDTSVAAEYHIIFKSGATAAEIVHPEGVNVGSFTVDANKIYEISISENLLLYQSWEVTA